MTRESQVEIQPGHPASNLKARRSQIEGWQHGVLAALPIQRHRDGILDIVRVDMGTQDPWSDGQLLQFGTWRFGVCPECHLCGRMTLNTSVNLVKTIP